MKIALTGGSYLAHSVIASAQRCLNLVPEPMPEGQKEPGPMAAYPTPGLRLLNTIGTGPIRAVRQATNGAFYVVSGHEVYSVNTTTWAGTLLGSITVGLHTPVSMADNTLDMLIVDGTANGWVVNLAANTMAPVVDPNGMFTGGDRVDYLDTFFVLNKPGTPQFYISGSLEVTFDPLDFANKSSYADLLKTIIVCKREVWLIGEVTTEVWYNAGATDIPAGSFPFAEVQSVFVDHGIAAKYSVANYDNGVFWLTRDRQGQGFVVMGAGYQTKRISTYAIEAEIAGYPRIDDAIGFCYQLSGHTFYVLTFPHADKTWVHDITTGLWHEWAWIDTNGEEHRHRSNCCWPVDGKTLVVGDWQNGNLYALDQKVFTDNGQPIKRARSFPHILNDGKRVFYRQFLADMDVGNTQQADITTTYQKIITWLPEIAQMNGVSVGPNDPPLGGVFIDWPRGFVYMVGQTGYQKYTTALVTQTALVTTVVPARNVFAGGVDPLSGCLIVQSGTAGNGVPVSKLDPNTFAVLATFGITEMSAPSYPASVWQGQDIVCVVCNGVSFGFLKENVFSGHVAGFRVDTMAHSGFFANIITTSTNNRGSIIAGKSGGTTASVFVSWDAITLPAPAVPLYRIDIAASATAYNPTTWPTLNPGITWTTVGMLPVSAVDPAWTGFSVYSLGYDLADGNVLLLAGTQNSADGQRLLKLNATTAAVMWNITIGASTVDLSGSRINGSLWIFANAGSLAPPTSSYRINTIDGTIDTKTISGVYATANSSAQQSDSDTSMLFYGGTFQAGSNNPIPVAGTSPYTGGWGFMGGQTVRIITTGTTIRDSLISLSWSNDRGHSYGNPVSQSIGAIGEYRTSLQWQRLEYSRDRVFLLEWSAPAPTALQGCWVDVTPAQS